MKRFPLARSSSREEKPLSPLRAKLHQIIFEADTPAGKGFDVLLLVAIVVSVLVAMLDTVSSIHELHGRLETLQRDVGKPARGLLVGRVVDALAGDPAPPGHPAAAESALAVDDQDRPVAVSRRLHGVSRGRIGISRVW